MDDLSSASGTPLRTMRMIFQLPMSLGLTLPSCSLGARGLPLALNSICVHMPSLLTSKLASTRWRTSVWRDFAEFAVR